MRHRCRHHPDVRPAAAVVDAHHRSVWRSSHHALAAPLATGLASNHQAPNQPPCHGSGLASRVSAEVEADSASSPPPCCRHSAAVDLRRHRGLGARFEELKCQLYKMPFLWPEARALFFMHGPLKLSATMN